MVFPTLFVAVVPLRFGAAIGCYGVVLATIGPRTTQELISPCPSCESLIWMCVCSGRSIDYGGVGMTAWFA